MKGANQFCQSLKGNVRLHPDVNEVAFQDGIQGMLPQLRAYRERYHGFFEKKSKNREVSLGAQQFLDPGHNKWPVRTYNTCYPETKKSEMLSIGDYTAEDHD